MSATVHLHVGFPKSGTSYVQRILSTHKEAIAADQGLLFPGEEWSAQVRAVRDVRKMGGRHGPVKGSWRALLDEMDAWEGDSVVSMEWLSAADTASIERIASDLSGTRLRVLFTLRDLGRTLPSTWQEGVKNRKSWSWQEFLEGITADDPQESAPGRRFWAKHDVEKLLHRWVAVVPPEHVTLVTVPPSDASRDLLWERVCDVLGIEPRDYAQRVPSSNESMGLESVELVRRLNTLSLDATRADYGMDYKQFLSRGVLAGRRGDEGRWVLPASLREWVGEQAERQVRAIESTGVRLVGDLTDLTPAISTRGQDDPVPDESVMLDAAVAALVESMAERSRQRAKRKELTDENDALKDKVARLQRRNRRLRARVQSFEARPVISAARMRAGRLRRSAGRRRGATGTG